VFFEEESWVFVGPVIYTETPYANAVTGTQLVGDRQVTYATPGGLGVGQRVQYAYRSFPGEGAVHTQPVATRTFLEDGTVRSTRRQFAADYSASAPAVAAPARGVRELQHAHVLTAAVEETACCGGARTPRWSAGS
jgi:hypothetical protein